MKNNILFNMKTTQNLLRKHRLLILFLKKCIKPELLCKYKLQTCSNKIESVISKLNINIYILFEPHYRQFYYETKSNNIKNLVGYSLV